MSHKDIDPTLLATSNDEFGVATVQVPVEVWQQVVAENVALRRLVQAHHLDVGHVAIGSDATSDLSKVTEETGAALFDPAQDEHLRTISTINHEIEQEQTFVRKIREAADPFYKAFVSQLSLRLRDDTGANRRPPTAPASHTPEYAAYVKEHSQNLRWEYTQETKRGPVDCTYEAVFLPTALGPLLHTARASSRYKEERATSTQKVTVSDTNTFGFDVYGDLVTLEREIQSESRFKKSDPSGFRLDLRQPMTLTVNSLGKEDTYRYNSQKERFTSQGNADRHIDTGTALQYAQDLIASTPFLPTA